MESGKAKRDTLVSAEENRAMFDRIAKSYDAANRAISMGMDRLWRRRAVRMLKPVEDGRYLDIGTGTGDLVAEILRQEPGARAVGIDPAERMLEIARGKIRNANARFEVADALALPMGDGAFDGIVLGFSFRNIVDRRRALEEMLRVLKPGGRAVVLEATRPSNPLARLGYRLYAPLVVPAVGKLFGDNSAYRYLVDSIEAFPPAESVAGMMGEAGFEQVACRPLALGAVSIFSGRKKQDG